MKGVIDLKRIIIILYYLVHHKNEKHAGILVLRGINKPWKTHFYPNHTTLSAHFHSLLYFFTLDRFAVYSLRKYNPWQAKS